MSQSYFISIIIHSVLLMVTLLLSPVLNEAQKVEPITIEVIDQPVQKYSRQKSIDSAPDVKLEPKSKPQSLKTTEKTQAKSAVKITNNNVAKSSSKGNPIPDSIDDIESSDLDYESVLVKNQGQLNGNEFDDEFKKIDQTHAQKLQNSVQNLNEEANDLKNDLDQQIGKTKSALASEAAALNRGAKSIGSAQGQIRSIENLRQIQGNPKPKYSTEERFQKNQGTVVFQAYVTDEGRLKDFKLIRSTGFKNLDGKTLAALKKWKFYPGQKGWVEIPQNWSLKGNSEEMPMLLRRSISQR